MRMNTVKRYMRQISKLLQHKAWLAVCFLILCACDVLDRNLTMLAIHSALAHLLFCQESMNRHEEIVQRQIAEIERLLAGLALNQQTSVQALDVWTQVVEGMLTKVERVEDAIIKERAT